MREPLQLLLVEDNPDDVLLLRRAMKKAGVPLPVAVATDGDDAVAYLEGRGAYGDRAAHPLPNLVLLDLKLPRRSGLEVLGWLRQQTPLARTVVVVLTSSREATDLQRAYALGANSYLVKPAEPDGLLDMVKALHAYWVGFNELAPHEGVA